jgi:hypothetical protein
MEYILTMVLLASSGVMPPVAILYPTETACVAAKEKHLKAFTGDWKWRHVEGRAICTPRWVQETSQ